jgi:hypothetical protein
VSGWQDALEAQMEIFKFWRSELGMVYGHYYVDDKVEGSPKRHGYEPDPAHRDVLVGNAPNLSSVEASKMLFADPIYVSDEMFQVAEAAGEMFKPEPLHETDLLTTRGLVLMPRPLIAPDINNKATTWRVFAWMPMQSPDGARSGIHVSTYTLYDDWQQDGYELDPTLKWQPLHVTPWWFGDKAPAREEAPWWGKCQAVLRLMMQQIAVRDERPAPRASRRRWQREMPEKSEPGIVVVRLRRPKSHPSGDHHTVDWKQQWIVGGHWRAQFYPSLGIHRQIWISNYVKGPADKPLVIRKGRAFELVR